MNESLIIFSREWAVTAALTTLLAPEYSRKATTIYDLGHLTRALQEQPHSPVVLGLRPHEHVADLYRLKSLLTGRVVLFVGRCFYWTDYSLPDYFGLTRYGFCSWDAMQDPFSRRMEMRRFRQLSAAIQKNESPGDKAWWPVSAVLPTTEMQILERANRWLYRELSVCGLTGYEVRVLWLMTDGRTGDLPSRTRSLHKNNGLYRLGMTKHVINLYRGVKVRPALQARLPLQAEESGTAGTANILRFRREAGR
ncbi:hypothetical protein RD136_001449 [Salmonella enterica]|nr:hypothetical protein [Salmonella enterica subsp. enterica serovar Oranienburg]EDU1903466.1 hypothetical protein [Salmonella enterica subsp. enterica serovar Oranienburg]EHF8059361.1 hypothetical protein [Salmonella enterica subsp. enterica serovar Oranienburg]EKY9495808.1 hypothetical protein [Salmonella enterica]